jgi:uncharacterized protein
VRGGASAAGKIGSVMADGKCGESGATGFEPRPFRAAPWLPGAHAQTAAGRLLRRPRVPAFERERWRTPDGDFVDLDFAPFDGPASAPVVLLLHGLEGSARRGYAIHTYDALARCGIRGVGLNFRSCSGEPNQTARFYHSGETEDVRFAIERLRLRHPGATLGAVGFSLGGNALIKYLAEEAGAGRARVSAAVAISVPYDLAAGARHLDATAMGRFYTRLFVRSLVAKVESKAVLLAGRCDIERIRAARTFREFDDAATAPLHGFDSAADYYARCSSRNFVAAVRTPTLLIHAADDPFMPPGTFPAAAVMANPCVTAVVTERGGHVGFVTGRPWRPRFWAEEQAARFLTNALRPLDTPALAG